MEGRRKEGGKKAKKEGRSESIKCGNLIILWRKIKPGRMLGSTESRVTVLYRCSEQSLVIRTIWKDD